MRDAARAEGRQVGIGLACYVEGTGVGPYEGGHVIVETSGKVKVATGLTSQGQGHQTVFAQIVADELGVPFEDIEVTTGDTRRFGYAVGTFASRAAVMSGSAIALAARAARAKILKVAAEALEADPDDLEIEDGIVRVKGAPGAEIGLGTVAVLSNPLRYSFDEASQQATQFASGDTSKPPVDEDDEPGIEGRDYFSPMQSTFASGMHAVVVETDPDTAEIKILRYCVVHDCGTLINPRIVEGQIHGGVAQGVGGALYERMAYDDCGATAERVVHGLPDAVRQRGAAQRSRSTTSRRRRRSTRSASRGPARPASSRALRRSRPRSRTPKASSSPPCPSRRASCSSCGDCTRREPDEGQRRGHPARPGREGVGRAERPGRARAHDPGLRAARVDRRRTRTR